jgi:hypothetical protein
MPGSVIVENLLKEGGEEEPKEVATPVDDTVYKNVKQFYFDRKGLLRNMQTDMMMDTESVLNGNLGGDVLPFVNSHIEEKMLDLGLEKISLPGPDAVASCDIYASSDLGSFANILVLVTNKRDTKPGIWSRGVCVSNGLNEGSMISTIKAAISTGYGLVILNARTNSHTTIAKVQVAIPEEGEADADEEPPDVMERAARKSLVKARRDTTHKVKVMVEGSETPEQHIVTVWEKVLSVQPVKVQHELKTRKLARIGGADLRSVHPP